VRVLVIGDDAAFRHWFAISIDDADAAVISDCYGALGIALFHESQDLVRDLHGLMSINYAREQEHDNDN